MKTWIIRDQYQADLIQDLLLARGISPDQTPDFLCPDYQRSLHDPFLLMDMDKAVRRIIQGIRKNEKIIIFADYDADGVPGAVVLADFFRQIDYQNFDVYIPDRHNEPYGLNNQAIEKLANQGADLIITVDCGIANHAEVAYAASLDLEVIITDHHLVLESGLPKAYAVINPKRPDDKYPNKMLAGAGVAFKLVQGLIKKMPYPPTLGWEKWLLDLVAIATVSDMMSLVGENRALVWFGLKVLRQTRRLGLQSLLRRLRLKSEYLTEDDIAFVIGPRINTASRMSHASQAYYLLTTTEPAVANTIATHLEEKNSERRASVDIILDDLVNQDSITQSSPPVIVAGHKDWSLGVLGLTASRVVEKHQRVVFLWGQNGLGEIKGSCRSNGSVNVVELMTMAGGDQLFSNYGGHSQAGGFSLVSGSADLATLQERLGVAYELLEKKEIGQEIIIDRELSLDQISESLYRQLQALAPFGIGNPKPIFLFSAVKLVSVKTFGATNNHLELGLMVDPDKTIKAIAFFNPFIDLKLRVGQTIDLAAVIEKSYFYRAPELRLRIVDLKILN